MYIGIDWNLLKKTYKWHPVQKWHLIFINLNFILCQNLSCKLQLIQSHWRNKISQCNNTVLSHEVMSICGERIIVTYRRMHFIPSSWIWPSDYGENYFESCYYFQFIIIYTICMSLECCPFYPDHFSFFCSPFIS